MIKSFNNKGTEDIFLGQNTKAARRQVEKASWPETQRLLHILNTIETAHTLLDLPGLRMEHLKYSKPGYQSIRVSNRFRIVFMWKDRNAYDVSAEDPRHHQS